IFGITRNSKESRCTYLVEEQQKNFCILSELARKYFAIQATSSASERLFSDARNIITNKRTSLKLEVFETLIFLKRNGLVV
ncbi:2049_t:CDS:1, partial [Racocetra persica]